MDNTIYKGSGEVLGIVAASELSPGQIVPVGNRLGVVQGLDTIPAGERAELKMEGVFNADVSTSGTYSFGAELTYSTGGSSFAPASTAGTDPVHALYWDTADTGASGVGKVYISPLL